MKFERLFKTIQIITFKLYLNSRFQTFISKMYRREKKGISCDKFSIKNASKNLSRAL